MPAKRKPRSSAQILKRSLGRDKTLLDSLPLDKVDFKQNEAPALDGGYHEHILHLGHILNESGVRHELFAYLTLSTEQEVLPEIHYYGCDPSDKLLRSFKAQDVVAKGSIREEFRLGLKTAHEFSTLLKSCFFLSTCGATLSEDVHFTSTFLSVLRRVCRRYQDDNADDAGESPSVQYPPLEKRASIQTPLAVQPSARKSEQHGLFNPRFDALYAQPVLSSSPFGTPTAISSVASHQPGGSANNTNAVSAGDGTPPSAPAAMRDTAARIRNKLEHETSRGFTTHSFERTPSASLNHPQPRSLQAPVCPQMSITNTPVPMPEPTASQTKLEKVLILHQDMQDVQEEINNAQANIATVNGEWHRRRADLASYIDQDVARRHEEEYTALKAQHKEEVVKLKAQYADVKRDHGHAVHVLEQGLKAKIQKRDGLQRELAAKQQGITTEEMLQAYLAQNSAKKRKRDDST
ncbi:hypothetical protein IQ06DRAFT_356285 [Phaeosphaeriaceae sp. SRC1lsM3a]|nr:hypothetical protein IQ06DRAFT_356285 [Stagonospora sp. SRC1lsM3a]